MAQPNVQFAVASHVMAALGAHHGEPVRSADLASSVNADPSFVRRVVSKLAKAGLVTTHRGKHGACALARPAAEITLLDIYLASEAPEACGVHDYAATECVVSKNFKGCLNDVLKDAQRAFEQALGKQLLSDLVDTLMHGK